MTIAKQRAAKHGRLKGLRLRWSMGSSIQGEQPHRAGVGMHPSSHATNAGNHNNHPPPGCGCFQQSRSKPRQPAWPHYSVQQLLWASTAQ